MDELKSRIGKACAGKSTEEIAQAIQASSHGASVGDPMALAALFKSWAS